MRDSEARNLPQPEFWCEQWSAGKDHSDLEGQRERWDKRAATFVHKNRKEDYISYFVEMLDLGEGDTIFDMACGAGALAIPLAERGHHVSAVDFSSEMLANLRAYAERKGVSDKIDTYQRAWEEDFDGLPVCDVAIASRSLILDDLADAVAKLESKARKRAVITLPGGAKQRHELLDTNNSQAEIPKSQAESEPESMSSLGAESANTGSAGADGCAYESPRYLAQSLVIVTNYLFSIGRLPQVSYIRYPHYSHGKTREELVNHILTYAHDLTPEREAAITAYLSDHIVDDVEEGGFTLDYTDMNRWSVIEWNPNER